MAIAISNKNEFGSDNVKLIKILENILFTTLLEEFKFLLGRTICGVDLLEMALKDGIAALYPHHSHLPGFYTVFFFFTPTSPHISIIAGGMSWLVYIIIVF